MAKKPKVRTDLLQLVVEKLENLPKKNKFDLSVWMRPSEKDEFSAFSPLKTIQTSDKIREIVEPIFCKTAGCAMGWATTIPEIRKKGLVLIQEDRTFGGKHYYVALVKKNKITHDHYAAVDEVFGLPYNIAEYLFSPDSYRNGNYTNISVKRVIKRINTFIENPDAVQKEVENL